MKPLLLLLFLLSFPIAEQSEENCVYTVYARTGSIIKGGTDSTISLTLFDLYGQSAQIENLEAWGGLMGPDYNYFERSNLDVFSGLGLCLSGPPCAMNLTSDGSRPHHGWYCNYIEVTYSGPHIPCVQQLFTVEQWLATNVAPYELTAIRNYCSSYAENGRHRNWGPDRAKTTSFFGSTP